MVPEGRGTLAGQRPVRGREGEYRQPDTEASTN